MGENFFEPRVREPLSLWPRVTSFPLGNNSGLNSFVFSWTAVFGSKLYEYYNFLNFVTLQTLLNYFLFCSLLFSPCGTSIMSYVTLCYLRFLKLCNFSHPFLPILHFKDSLLVYLKIHIEQPAVTPVINGRLVHSFPLYSYSHTHPGWFIDLISEVPNMLLIF